MKKINWFKYRLFLIIDITNQLRTTSSLVVEDIREIIKALKEKNYENRHK